MMIDELKTFQMFKSYKLHFNNSYDIKKYGLGKKRFNQNVLNKARDRYVYGKVGKEFLNENDFSLMLYGNLFYNPQLWVGDLLNDKAHDRYLRAKSVKASLERTVIEDVKSLVERHGSFTKTLKDGSLINDVTAGRFNPESFVILDRVYGIKSVIDKYQTDIIWETVKMRLDKIGSFITVPDLYFYDTIRYNILDFIRDK